MPFVTSRDGRGDYLPHVGPDLHRLDGVGGQDGGGRSYWANAKKDRLRRQLGRLRESGLPVAKLDQLGSREK